MDWQQVPLPITLEDGQRYRLSGSGPGIGDLDAGKLREIIVEFRRADASIMEPAGPRFAVESYGVIPESKDWYVVATHTHDTRNWAQGAPGVGVPLPPGYTGNSFSALFVSAASTKGVWLVADTLEIDVAPKPAQGAVAAAAGKIGWAAAAAVIGYFVLQWWKG